MTRINTRLPRITARLREVHGDHWIDINRGYLASIKIRLDEAHDLADQLHDLAEQEDT